MLATKYLDQSLFDHLNDFNKNLKINVPENFNFAYDIVDEYARIEPEKKALVWTNDQGQFHEFSFADIKRYSDQTASYFQSLGISHGDRVMLILKRRFEFWFSIIALHKIGAVCIPATHLLKKKDLVYRNNSAGVKAIVAVGEDEITKEVDEAMQHSPSVGFRISVGPSVKEGWLDFKSGIATAPPFASQRALAKNSDISLLYFTSGTTGNPKMVAHNFTYPLGHIVTALYWHKVSENDLHLTVADTGWGKAVWGKLYGQWLAGAAVFVYDHEKFDPVDLLSVISKYKVNTFCAPPTVYRFLIREDFSAYDLSALKYCTVAGEPLSAEVYNRFFKLTGIKLMEGYGQTETTLTIATFPWMEPKPGAMGMPNPAYKIDLLHPEGRFCEDGEVGEIVVQTSEHIPVGLFKEYHCEPERTKAVWHNGYYYTGDLAWRDEDGYFWFVGRADDVIKSSGYRIGPFEVESALMEHPAVVECAVTAVPDEVRGQVVKATIVLAKDYRPGTAELSKEIQDHVKHTTAPYKYPRVVEFVDELPKTISGKIRRVEIRGDEA
ncbi:AMP-binding protein [Sunxiuqinia elliptica]|uniref:Acetyl-CoA synthetase n=1 Tax=Sunxiuqinia elliptica TaxID=655355 RepID=A0A4R6H4M6_9BACT|nr:AMP-binding protein [Sunxiuqinia elliptica]TDO03070.1 acetyl-CoA synthetase [Sunxiuqinia elliptica]TDO59269.1 acetyl-CoA synthetase [Sunxiuqinia elliptica]